VRETLNHHKDFEDNPDQEIIFFCEQQKQDTVSLETDVGNIMDVNSRVILILCHSILGLNNKLLELAVLLQSDLKNIDGLCLYDAVQYLFTTVGSPPSGCGPCTCAPKARTVIYIRRNNTDHRTHKI